MATTSSLFKIWICHVHFLICAVHSNLKFLHSPLESAGRGFPIMRLDFSSQKRTFKVVEFSFRNQTQAILSIVIVSGTLGSMDTSPGHEDQP